MHDSSPNYCVVCRKENERNDRPVPVRKTSSRRQHPLRDTRQLPARSYWNPDGSRPSRALPPPLTDLGKFPDPARVLLLDRLEFADDIW